MKKRIIIIKLIAIFILFVTNCFAKNYYVDGNKGDDSNEGTSASAAWKTINKVNNATLLPGDSVLFSRNQIIRGNLFPKSGNSFKPITYGAYGTGNKPQIYGSANRKLASYWTSAGTNIWKTSIPQNVEAGIVNVDAGNLIFNNEESCGVKVSSVSLLLQQGDFYCNPVSHYLLLYSVGNPGSYYSNIEMALGASVITIYQGSYITVQDLDIRYTGAHGIGTGGGVDHIVVQRCDLSFIGGSYQVAGYTGRYGNGVEFWQAAHDCKVQQCSFKQIYDAAMTSQGVADDNGKYQVYNLYFLNNIVDKSEYAFEYWLHGSGNSTHDVYFENNTCLNAGMSWGHAQRPDPNGSFLTFWGFDPGVSFNNIFIRNNIFSKAVGAGIFELYTSLYDLIKTRVTINNNCWNVASQLAICSSIVNDATINTYYDWSYYTTNTGQDVNSFSSDPLLKNDYSLSDSSPCINAGLSLSNITNDFINVTRPKGNAFDIGAYEYNGGVVSANVLLNDNYTSKLALCPNPATSFITVELPDYAVNEKLQIYNSNGQLVQEMDVLDLKQQVNVYNLPGGVYFIRLASSSCSTVKFIKQ